MYIVPPDHPNGGQLNHQECATTGKKQRKIKLSADPSTTEVVAYNVLPLNSDSEFRADVSADPSTTECVAYNIVPSDHSNSDNLDYIGSANYQECAIMDKKQRKINDFLQPMRGCCLQCCCFRSSEQ